MSTLATYSKAIAAALGSLVGALGAAAADGTVTASEWIGVVAAVAAATIAVFAAPKNAVADGEV